MRADRGLSRSKVPVVSRHQRVDGPNSYGAHRRGGGHAARTAAWLS
ncbi:hypothetical protein ACFPM0_15910 [Pseudonocardia sulfidoxydans]